MIIKQLPRSVWEGKLRRWACRPMDGKGRLNTAEWWIGKNGPFTVPIDEDGTCEFWALQMICKANGIDPREADNDPATH